MNILCITQLPEQESEGPTTAGMAPNGPTTIHATFQLALTLQKISDEVQAQKYTLQSIETYMQQRFVEI